MRKVLLFEQRLPIRDRYFIRANRSIRSGQPDSAAASYDQLLRRYPYDVSAFNNLALIRINQRRYAEAESLFVRAASVDSTIANFYFGMHSIQLLRGRFDESQRTLDLIARRFPGNPVLGTVRIHDASAQQDWDLAERRAREKIAEAGNDTLESVDAHEALAQILMTQGRLADADKEWRTHFRVAATAGSHGRLLYGAVQRAQLHMVYRGDTARAIALVDSALQRYPLGKVLPGDRPYDDLARFNAAAGRLAQARALLAGADSNDRALGRTLGADRRWTRGAIALAEGGGRIAVEELRRAANEHTCEICPLPTLARAQEATGDQPGAIKSYERYLSTPWYWRYEPDAVEIGRVLSRLADLRAANGDSVGAANARTRLAQVWHKSDGALRSALADR